MVSIHVTACLSLFYICSSGIILLVYLVPQLNSRFLAYGARETQNSGENAHKEFEQQVLEDSSQKIITLLDSLAKIRVPHAWFLHFYILSVASSIVWLYQFLKHGELLRHIIDYAPQTQNSITLSQLSICWALMSLQGFRRLYECVVLSKPSRSTMWFGHYAIGLLFYLVTGLAVCIQGFHLPHSGLDIVNAFSLSDLPSASYVFVPLFLAASYMQHSAHVHLASLKKYTIPTKGLFSFLIAPHYTAECVIYLCLAALATPSWQVFNLGTPLIWAFLFVVINLGVSAEMTRTLTAARFGDQAVQGKWRMICGIW